MAAFCWMLVEGIDLYFLVVKVYNINTKMYMYHVISWAEFIISLHALETVIMLSDSQTWCCYAVKCFDILSFLHWWVGVPVILVRRVTKLYK